MWAGWPQEGTQYVIVSSTGQDLNLNGISLLEESSLQPQVKQDAPLVSVDLSSYLSGTNGVDSQLVAQNGLVTLSDISNYPTGGNWIPSGDINWLNLDQGEGSLKQEN